MDIILYSIIAAFGSVLAGFLGALTGLGGGVLIVPLLTLVCGVEVHYAIGASLVSIIATSSAAAVAYVKDGYTNLRVAMFLGIPTTIGAIIGAILAMDMAKSVLSIIFGSILVLIVLASWLRPPKDDPKVPASKLGTLLKMNGTYPGAQGLIYYNVIGVPVGFLLMFMAGSLSGLLGIGSGAIKVLALDSAMRIPFRVSTATSNLMIGVTAAASAGLYFTKGYVNPTITMPVVLGVLLGSFVGAKMMRGFRIKVLRQIFTYIVIIIGLQMVYHGIS